MEPSNPSSPPQKRLLHEKRPADPPTRQRIPPRRRRARPNRNQRIRQINLPENARRVLKALRGGNPLERPRHHAIRDLPAVQTPAQLDLSERRNQGEVHGPRQRPVVRAPREQDRESAAGAGADGAREAGEGEVEDAVDGPEEEAAAREAVGD